MKITGSYKIQKRNVITGEITNYPENHNVVTTDAHKRLCRDMSGGYAYTLFGTLYIGDGSREPSAGDTALTHQLWSVGRTNFRNEITSKHSCAVTARYIIPATSSYVGTIREIGQNSPLQTHCLLKDAEGNPYEIPKTDIDEVTIEYRMTIEAQDTGAAKTDVISFMASDGAFCAFRYGSGGYTIRAIMGMFLCEKVMLNNDYFILNRTSSYNGTVKQGAGSPPGANDNTAWLNENTLVYNSAKLRAVKDAANLVGHYIHFYSEECKRQHGVYIELPDGNIFAEQNVAEISVGTGDGSTQDFTCPIPFFVADTDKVYVDGVQKVRDVDYTIDWFANSQKCTELIPSAQMFIVSGDWSQPADRPRIPTTSIYAYLSDFRKSAYNPMFDAYVAPRKRTGTNIGSATGTLMLAEDHPLVFEMPIDRLGFDWNVDTCYISSPLAGNYVSGSYQRPLFSLEKSDDKNTWTPVFTDEEAYVSWGSNNTLPSSAAAKKITFQETTARYWRLSIKTRGQTATTAPLAFVLMRTGRPIHFVEAPASGAIITMDAHVDRPYMDGDHVTDFQYSVQY